jgi:hypothetical protein
MDSNYTWYENKRMLIFFENDKPILVLSGKIAEQTKIHFAIRTLEEWLVENPEGDLKHEIIIKRDKLKQRLNAI